MTTFLSCHNGIIQQYEHVVCTPASLGAMLCDGNCFLLCVY